MNQSFPEWYHETGIDISDEEIKKRWQGVEAFIKNLKVHQGLDLVRLFNGSSAQEYREPLGAAMQTADATFRVRNNDLEMRLLAGAALAEALTARPFSTVNDAIALALVNANCRGLVSVDARIQDDVISAANRYLLNESIRVRNVHENTFSGEVKEEIAQAIEGFKEGFTQPALAAVKDTLGAPLVLLEAELVSHSEQLKRIAYELQIQREESNMAWWVMGKYSRNLERPFTEYRLPAVCLIAGKELAELTELMPGPRSAPALLDRVLECVVSEIPESISLQDAINGAPIEWRKTWTLTEPIKSVADFCPVQRAVVASVETSEWVEAFNLDTSINATQPFKPLDLALQTYQESLLTKILLKGNL